MADLRHSLRLKHFTAAALALLLATALAPAVRVTAQVRTSQLKERSARPSATADDAAPRAAESRRAEQTGATTATTTNVGETNATTNAAARRTPSSAVAAPNTKQKWTAAPRRSAAPSAPMPLAPATEGQLIISEFRYNGTAGPLDEFIEIYNASGADLTVQTSDMSAGYAVAASDGVARFTIPNGTVIPARGHYLGCNSSPGGYSVASYPAGNGTTATCDATYTTDIPINAGIALFNTANSLNFTLANRLDAVGATAEANALYKEGVGVRNLSAFPVAYSYTRRRTGGCIGTNPGTADSNCTNTAAIAGTPPPASLDPQDTDNNRTDFIFVDTNGTQTSTEASQQRIGAPGPENLSSPIVRTSAAGAGVVKASLIDVCAGNSLSPNRVRDLTNDPAEPSDTFGSLFIRRKFTNNTGANVTRLRFRIVDITTFPSAVFSLPPPPNDFCGAPGSDCAADLRALTSTDVIVSVSAPCGGGTVTVRGTTVEQAASPGHQPSGGGFNTTMSAGVITLATPLRASDDPGTPNVKENEINLQFRFGVQQIGTFRVFMVVEVLP